VTHRVLGALGNEKGEEGEMGENVSTGSRPEFLARVQRFTDEMLGSLDKASLGKDVDEKEARSLRTAILRSLGIWEKALHDSQHDPRIEDKLRRIEKQASQIKTGEA